jgi:hypothetical protein
VAALCAALAAFCLSRLAGSESAVEQPTSFDAKLRPAPTAGS